MLWHNLYTMTIQQLAKQLNIPVKKLEKESLRSFLLSRLGEIEASRSGILKRYGIESVQDWDDKLRKSGKHEGGYKELTDYFILDSLESEKETVIKDLLSF